MFLLLRVTVPLNRRRRQRQENRIRAIAIILSVGDPETSDNGG
jgi:hypothetical protein